MQSRRRTKHAQHREPLASDKTLAQAIVGSPAIADRLIALEKAGLLKFGDQPDFIVGGVWPTTIAGAVGHDCDLCGVTVTLSPDSGLAMSRKFPHAAVLCWRCAERIALESGK